MESLELLKEELKKQKQAIESKGGTVLVQNLNPSPAEITTAIASISLPDMTTATATAEDVMSGKTFYAGDSQLKTGTLVINEGGNEGGNNGGDSGDTGFQLISNFVENQDDITGMPTVSIDIPSGTSVMRPYLFAYLTNPFSVTLNSELSTIDKYGFYYAENIDITNLSEMENLTSIGEYCFYRSSVTGMDLANMPECITSIGSRSFSESQIVRDSNQIVINSTLKNIGSYAFSMATTRKEMDSLTLEMTADGSERTFAAAVFENLGFNCDFVVPSNMFKVPSQFNYKGSFNNVTIPSHVTKLEDWCFGGLSSDTVANYRLKTVTFESATPPTISSTVFALHAVTNGLKIYVPDEAVDTYKAVNNLKKNYLNIIYPVSQKE